MSKFSRFIEYIRLGQREFYLTEMQDETWVKRSFFYLICFVHVFVAEVRNLRLFTRVASGTYTMMLALIPFMVVGGSLILTFNQNADIGGFIEKTSEFILPFVGNNTEIIDTLKSIMERTRSIGLGPFGVISLLVTSVMLFVHIEDCFNDIWHVTKPRAFFLRILLFYAIVTLAPLVLSYSVMNAATIIPNEITQNEHWKYLRETLVLAVACFVAFKFLPNTRVHYRNAIIPAVLVAILLEIAKSSFGIYVSFVFTGNEHSNYNVLYGALGIIPITLLWIYLMWVMVLFGAEAGYCLQNMRSLRLRMCYDTAKGDGESWVFIGTYAALEVIAALVRNLCKGSHPMTTEEIAVACIYPIEAVEAILGRLEKINAVKKVEGEFSTAYLLAKPLDAILIRQIMETFDESSPRVRKFPKLNALVEQLLAAQNQIWTDSNINVLREDGVALKDISEHPTEMNLNVNED